MAYFNSNVDALLRSDLDTTYEDMAFGDQLAAIIGLFKKEDRSGDGVKVPVKYGIGPGQGATAATAYANASNASRDAFQVTPFKLYGQSIIDLSQSVFTGANDNAVVDLLLDESKTAMDSAKIQLDQALASDGSGTLGTIASSTNPSGSIYVLVLTQASDVNNFSFGQILVSKATAFAGSLDTGTATITAVTASNKSITVTGNGGWTPANTHVLGVQGTMAASTGNVTFPGIPAWIPPIASRPLTAGVTFYSVDRSKDETKLAGSALDGTNMQILEGIEKLAHMVANVPGAKPDMVVCSYATLSKIQSTLQTQKRYVEVRAKGVEAFYSLIEINGPTGPMYLCPSSHWSDSYVAVLTSDSWVLGAPKNKPFMPATSNGNPVVEIPGADEAVAQYRAQGFVYCTAPGYNGMLTITA